MNIRPAERLLKLSVKLFDCECEFADVENAEGACGEIGELWDQAVIDYKAALAAPGAIPRVPFTDAMLARAVEELKFQLSGGWNDDDELFEATHAAFEAAFTQGNDDVEERATR